MFWSALGSVSCAPLSISLKCRWLARKVKQKCFTARIRDAPDTFNFLRHVIQKNSKRLWRSRRRKSSSVPAGAANFPAAVFLAGKCPNLGRDSISRCRKIWESFSSSVEICRKTFPAGNFGQPQPSRVF